MPLQCNIDAQGKRLRLIYGIVLVSIGLVMYFTWASASGSMMGWMATIVVFLAGGFCMFEARAGWCALRAMGIKTRL